MTRHQFFSITQNRLCRTTQLTVGKCPWALFFIHPRQRLEDDQQVMHSRLPAGVCSSIWFDEEHFNGCCLCAQHVLNPDCEIYAHFRHYNQIKFILRENARVETRQFTSKPQNYCLMNVFIAKNADLGWCFRKFVFVVIIVIACCGHIRTSRCQRGVKTFQPIS